MSEMVDRVAKAIFLADGSEAAARAAIATMSVLTTEMIEAGWNTARHSHYSGVEFIAEIWLSMHAAMLVDESATGDSHKPATKNPAPMRQMSRTGRSTGGGIC
jgi:hypothetical protein